MRVGRGVTMGCGRRMGHVCGWVAGGGRVCEGFVRVGRDWGVGGVGRGVTGVGGRVWEW